MATYIPDDGVSIPIVFGLLVDPPGRRTEQTMSERLITARTSA
jgi:hypothetical protein